MMKAEYALIPMFIAIIVVLSSTIPALNEHDNTTEGISMDTGKWFEYKVKETTSDKTEIKEWTEKYVIVSVNGDDVVFDLFVDGEKKEQVEGKTTYANCLVRNDDLSIVGSEKIDTVFGEKTVDVYGSQRCGGSTSTYQEGDMMYRSIEKQMWSMGIIHTLTRNLVKLG